MTLPRLRFIKQHLSLTKGRAWDSHGPVSMHLFLRSSFSIIFIFIIVGSRSRWRLGGLASDEIWCGIYPRTPCKLGREHCWVLSILRHLNRYKTNSKLSIKLFLGPQDSGPPRRQTFCSRMVCSKGSRRSHTCLWSRGCKSSTRHSRGLVISLPFNKRWGPEHHR